MGEAKKRAQEELEFHVNKRIAEQFSEPRIKKILEEVAATEAKGVIEKQVEPVVTEAKNTINNLQEDLLKDVNRIRADFEEKLVELRQEVDFQKKLNEIQVLQYSALADCDVEAFNSLDHYENGDKNLMLAARNAIFTIKAFYVTTSRFTNEDFSGRLRDGSTVKLKDLETPKLLKELTNKNMYVRGLASVFLGRRKECDVPETLLKVLSSDESLCVRTEALKSFQRITKGQFDAQDVFGFQAAQKWYDENRTKVRQELECKDSGQ